MNLNRSGTSRKTLYCFMYVYAPLPNVNFFRPLIREHTGPYLMLREREGACVMCRDH